jgi:molybdopterin converting factor subunit 1
VKPEVERGCEPTLFACQTIGDSGKLQVMARIKVEYFAILRDHTGCSAEDVDTRALTPADLYNELNQRYSFPETGQLKVAVNDEFSDWDAELQDGDSIVFIPPVAGG